METPKANPIHSSIILAGIIVILVLWLIKFFGLTLPLTMTTQVSSGELSVVGVGKVDAIPDTANVSAGIVVTNAASVNEAQSKINDINNRIVAGIIALGIDKKDIKTTDYSINPNYSYTNGQSVPSGFNANATVSVKVTKTQLLPKVIEAVTAGGANQVNNTTYSIDNPDKYREEARDMAIQNAKDQAQKLASQAGIHLGKIVNIIESSPDTGPIPYLARSFDAAPMAAGAAPDLQAGSQTINSQVTLFFERQ